jgi:hypothetical protein
MRHELNYLYYIHIDLSLLIPVKVITKNSSIYML